MWKYGGGVLSNNKQNESDKPNGGGFAKRSSSGGANRTFVAPPLSYNGRQIHEMLLKVKLIEDECLGHNEEDKEKLDEFVALKKEIYFNIFSTKKLIRERCEIQSAQGNTVQAIEKGTVIKTNIETLTQQFIKLKETFKKQSKQAKSNHLTTAELDTRFQELQVIKQQIEECRDLMKRGTEYPEAQMKTLTDFVKQMEQAGIAPPAQFDNSGSGWREPTAEEQSTINRWAERDKDFDRQIWQVGAGVDRLKGIALDIGEKARQQEEATVRLTRQADEANEQVVEVNAKLKSLMMQRGGFNFCCKLVLTVVLIILLGFIIKNITNRITMPRVRRMAALAVSPAPLVAGDIVSGGASNGNVNESGTLKNVITKPGLRHRIFVNGTLRPMDDVIWHQLINSARQTVNGSLEPDPTGSGAEQLGEQPLPQGSPLLWGVVESTSRNSWSRFQKHTSPPPPQQLSTKIITTNPTTQEDNLTEEEHIL